MRFSNFIKDVWTLRGADSDSDQFVVKGTIKVKVKNPVRSTGAMWHRYDVSKLETEERSLVFKNRFNKQVRITWLDSIVSIDEKWKKLKDSIKSVPEVLGKKKQKQRCDCLMNYVKKHLTRENI